MNKKFFGNTSLGRCCCILGSLGLMALLTQLTACAGRSVNNSYAKHTKTTVVTMVPAKAGAAPIANKPYYPVPTVGKIAANPTVSAQPPGNQFSQYIKPGSVKGADGQVRAKQIVTYFTKGTNGAPILVISANVANSWDLIGKALTKASLKVVAKDRSLETYMIAMAGGGHKRGPLPVYGVHLVTGGANQTAITISDNRQAVAASKPLLQRIAQALP